jgi:hypothetical protein
MSTFWSKCCASITSSREDGTVSGVSPTQVQNREPDPACRAELTNLERTLLAGEQDVAQLQDHLTALGNWSGASTLAGAQSKLAVCLVTRTNGRHYPIQLAKTVTGFARRSVHHGSSRSWQRRYVSGASFAFGPRARLAAIIRTNRAHTVGNAARNRGHQGNRAPARPSISKSSIAGHRVLMPSRYRSTCRPCPLSRRSAALSRTPTHSRSGCRRCRWHGSRGHEGCTHRPGANTWDAQRVLGALLGLTGYGRHVQPAPARTN